MCGENTLELLKHAYMPGSPPHVRGKHAYRSHYLAPYRITPACAGKTLRFVADFLVFGDHPRMCGENQSPCHCHGSVSGITPACAGKTAFQF